MKKPVLLSLTPRARRDIDELVRFIGRCPRGKPEHTRRRILDACMRIRDFPELNPVEVRRRRSGIELRRYNVPQFSIVYAYFPPVDSRPWGIVTVRGARHLRVENVFFGVRDGGDTSNASVPLRSGESSVMVATEPCSATRDS